MTPRIPNFLQRKIIGYLIELLREIHSVKRSERGWIALKYCHQSIKSRGMTKSYLDQATERLLGVADIAFTAGCGLNTSASWGPNTTFPADWVRTYMMEGYQSIDPVLKYSCEGRGPINWRDLPTDDANRIVLEHAKEFGLRNGTVFANIVQGLKCSISVCHSKETLDDAEIAVLEEYTVIYATMTPRKSVPPKDETRLRYLDLQSNGATGEQIQNCLKLSARSLAELKKDAVAETSTRNLPHAIYSAMSANLI